MTSTTASKKYEKKDPIEHVLLRPDMYVGSTIAKLSSEFVCEKVENEGDEGGHFFQIIKKDVNVSLALLRIFIEILSNSVDNVFRSRQANIPCSYIKIKVNKETGETSIINDGDIIPIEINPENKMYNHTLVFGNLLSGSNFDDEKERLISGKNGLGSSLCNIFSTKFTVKGLDPNNNKTFQQTWTNNMKTVGEPIIEKTKLTKGYTSVCYFPDFKQFKMNGYDDETISMYLKLCVDAAMLTKVKVYFNDDLIPVNNLQSYAKLYKSDSEDSLFLKTDNSEVLLQPCNQFQTISFVNGIYTKLGGEHVDGWSEALFRPIVDKFNSKKGTPSLNIGDIKRFFRLFVVSYVVNPVFESQSKNKLESPSVKAVVKNSDIAKIMKWSVIEDIEDIIKSKEMIVLKKTEKKKRGYVKINGLDQANKAGTKESHLCSLILCEGLSAKTYGLQGIQKGIQGLTGRDYFGIMSLLGKTLNVRNADTTSIAKNKVITDLIQALNLQYGVDYTDDENFKTLSYGKVIFLTDADSVTFDTPCLLKNIETNLIEIKAISEIYDDDKWIVDELSGKEYNYCNKYLVWSDNGWTKIKGIMRHKVNKKIQRVLTHSGCVDVTEDHSLIQQNGESITSKECIIQETNLLHKTLKFDNKNIINLYTDEYAYVLGYFQADGNVHKGKVRLKRKDGSICNTFNYKWNITCVDEEPLIKLKKILEKYENLENKIEQKEIIYPKRQCTKCFLIVKDSCALKKHYQNKNLCYDIETKFIIEKKKVSKGSFSELSGRTYKFILEAKGNRKSIFTKYRNMFYNSLNEKIVPLEILNSSIDIQKSFLEGFYAGDGNKGDRTTDCFDGEYKSQIMGLFQILQNCGYTPSINCDAKKLNVYKIMMSKFHSKPSYQVKKIIDVSKKYENTYVYDLETENHHFHASIGNMIVHNTDGIHCSSLLINFFHHLFPSLLKRKEPFLISMLTPIVRVFGKDKSKDLLFYDEDKYKKFAETNPKHKAHYYKGLGTTKAEDVTDTFGEKIIEYLDDENTEKSINKVFNKKFADERKRWIECYNSSNNICFDGEVKNISLPLSEYLEKEMIKFSREDCHRSIANLFDGFKESQRKAVYGAKKKNLTSNKSPLKVAQFGSYVAEITDYKHGEQNLYDTIIRMAQEFVGSNNIPYFTRDGMFGSRQASGNDSASPRYVFTKMETLTPLIYREDDDVLLEHVYDGNDMLEPTFYIPILPMILINGCKGIGTGWSTNIPNFNPLDVIKCVKIWLNNKDSDILTEYPEMKPWYRGFTGEIRKNGDKFITSGIYTKDKNKVTITELPVSMSINSFKETVEDWLSEKKIKAFKNYSTPNKPYFVITEDEDGMSCNAKNMKLEDSIALSNMVLFDENNNLKKYTVEQIINDFCDMRYIFYDKRKKYILNKLEYELRFLSNKMRFIKEVVEKTLKIMNIPEQVIIEELQKRGYDKEKKNNSEDDESEENNNGYNYLLRLQVRNFTSDKVKELQNDIINIEEKINNVKKTSLKKMWLNDIEEFEVAYEKWLKNVESILAKEKNSMKGETVVKKTRKVKDKEVV
jgi:DNA gyrase/topoisomerase IV subunit B